MPQLLESRRGDVLVLTLNRPEKRNALTAEMRSALLAVLERETAAPSARALLVRGAGGAFCAGADATPDTILARRTTIEAELKAGMNRIVSLIAALSYPVVAAVQGPAAGAGTGLALAGDLMVAAPSARLHMAFTKIGAVPDAGTVFALTHKLGVSRAASLVLLGEVIEAEQALEWGLAAKLLSETDFEDEAYAFAAHLAAGPTRALGLTKRLVVSARSGDLGAHLALEARLQAEAFASPDFDEGVRARAEKRTPKFSGR